MIFDHAYLSELVAHPTESLSVEVKGWIDPSTPEGIAKIVKACIALRNNDGGCLLIGFCNDTFEPEDDLQGTGVRTRFHQDVIQSLISKYAHVPFESAVHFVHRDGREHPVICIPGGVKTPVAARADLRDPRGAGLLIKEHAVYVRSLNANNTVSTCEARNRDWERIVSTCLDNREADIARFVRRHLAGLGGTKLEELLGTLASRPIESPTRVQRAHLALDRGADRFAAVTRERGISLDKCGTWEVAFAILGELPEHHLDQSFLNLASSSNPHFSGWPTWLDSRGFGDTESHPYVYEGAWEALIDSNTSRPTAHLTFWRIDPEGTFFQWRVLDDEGLPNSAQRPPLSTLDFPLVLWRVTEAIAVALSCARALAASGEEPRLAVCFRWSGLRGRELSSRSEPARFIMPGRIARQDVVTADAEVPIAIPDSAIYQYVQKVTRALFEVFEGAQFDAAIYEGIARQVLVRGRFL